MPVTQPQMQLQEGPSAAYRYHFADVTASAHMALKMTT